MTLFLKSYYQTESFTSVFAIFKDPLWEPLEVSSVSTFNDLFDLEYRSEFFHHLYQKQTGGKDLWGKGLVEPRQKVLRDIHFDIYTLVIETDLMTLTTVNHQR